MAKSILPINEETTSEQLDSEKIAKTRSKLARLRVSVNLTNTEITNKFTKEMKSCKEYIEKINSTIGEINVAALKNK